MSPRTSALTLSIIALAISCFGFGFAVRGLLEALLR